MLAGDHDLYQISTCFRERGELTHPVVEIQIITILSIRAVYDTIRITIHGSRYDTNHNTLYYYLDLLLLSL